MPIPRDHVRHIFFYMWRRCTGATVAAHNISGVWGRTPLLSPRSSLVRSRKETQDSETGHVRDAPSPSTAPSLSAPTKKIRKLTAAVLRRDLGASTVLGLLQALGYRKAPRWIPVLADSRRYTRVPICQTLLPRLHRKEFLEDLFAGDRS
ncbi:hypothetical protein V3C99_018214 [Haemonchus contortus]|uniref:Uncharacterized protein n=1 Tax=Haemonchus contortus TaxID=6289 RepID=A0A7I4Z1V7_HAECO